MANEAPNGLVHCIQTREVGVRMIERLTEPGAVNGNGEAVIMPDRMEANLLHDAPAEHAGTGR